MAEVTPVVRFMLIGTLNALITVAVVWLMMDEFDCNYIATNITAYIIAQINNFFWSKYWIFTSRKGKFRREVPLFLIAFGCAYFAQFLALLVMVEVLDLNEYLAQFLGLFVYGAVNYLMNKRVTFLHR
ncbi:MAG: GtrA family protein [Parabacteroides sp.]|nr:GtrA family protein [Parabacteroides sp.]